MSKPSTLRKWPKSPNLVAVKQPKRIQRPCDSGLKLAVMNLETQLGSIEAYNRLAEVAAALKAQIDAGNAKPQNAYYATNTGSII